MPALSFRGRCKDQLRKCGLDCARFLDVTADLLFRQWRLNPPALDADGNGRISIPISEQIDSVLHLALATELLN